VSYRIYHQDAAWFELLTSPDDYIDEAELLRQALVETADGPVRTVLELGTGGGCNAAHLKKYFRLTLVDLSPAMIELARRRNPECEHIPGEKRSVRLSRCFDSVFIHDAITYMTTLEDLRAALETAFVHCRPGGSAAFMPKFLRESFTPVTRHGGTDGSDGRAMRYLHWCNDPDPQDTCYTVHLTFVMREADGGYRVESEEHINGFFPRATWNQLLADVGFVAPQFHQHEGAHLVLAQRPSETI
jgi:SAM-dependent methyltransferase